MGVPPFADSFMSAAIAKSRIRIFKIKLAILRGRGKHKRHDSCLSRVELRILLKNRKDKLVRLQREYVSRTSHGETNRDCRVATVRSDINGNVPWLQKGSKLVDCLLRDHLSRFAGMQP